MTIHWEVPYEVTTKPVLVGFCPECELVYDPYPGPSTRCDGDEHWTKKGTIMLKRLLLKRLMYKCPSCDGYYLTIDGFRYHEHWYV